MTDKTLGAYQRTTPDPDETTVEALARLQAEMTRLLDEADAELRDAAEGGVTAALIEQEADRNADGRPFCTAELGGFACSREDGHDGPHVAATCDVQNSICEVWPAVESRPLTPDAITDQFVDYVHEDYFWSTSDRVRLEKPALKHALLDAVERLAEASARPEGAETWEDELEGMPAADDLTPEQRTRLADALAERDRVLGVRVVSEDGAA